MDPTPMVLLVGVGGGLVIAYLLMRVHRARQAGTRPDPLGEISDAAKTDPINIAAIRVAGVGGLGLVVMALAVALGVPRIGQTLTVSAALGVGLAAVLILRRRHAGSMPSSGRRFGANTTLSIDRPIDARDTKRDQPLERHLHEDAVPEPAVWF